MAQIEKFIEVFVPVRTAYNQWTQFEEFPRFMEGVKEVRQLDDKRLFWRAEIAGVDKEWQAEIVEQDLDRIISWRSTSGAPNNGTVLFEPLDANRTRIILRLDYEPEGVIENIGDALGAVSMRVEGDLDRFKNFIERRGAETGAWRGEIHGGQVQPGGSDSLQERSAGTLSGAPSDTRASALGDLGTHVDRTDAGTPPRRIGGVEGIVDSDIDSTTPPHDRRS